MQGHSWVHAPRQRRDREEEFHFSTEELKQYHGQFGMYSSIFQDVGGAVRGSFKDACATADTAATTQLTQVISCTLP